MKPSNLRISLDILSKAPDKKGSVQDIYRIDLENQRKKALLCRTTDSGSVFDVGTIFTVPQSGMLRTIIRHFIYTGLGDANTWKGISEDDVKECYLDESIREDLLSHSLFSMLKENGVLTHHIGMADRKTGIIHSKGLPENPSNLVVVEELPVFKPKRFKLWNRYGWDYNDYIKEPRKVIALENIFRLGCPGGSSLLQRYNSVLNEGGIKKAHNYLQSIGLSETPAPWKQFSNMLYDFTTKYEPQDRQLLWQEAMHISGVSAEVYGNLIRILTYCTIYTYKFFKELGFKLWDLKWEAGVDGDTIMIVDTMDPDSVRVTGETVYNNRKWCIHFNKQAIRDYYRIIHEKWYNAVNDAKNRSKNDLQGRDFLQIYREGVKNGDYPDIPKYDEYFVEIQCEKYALMAAPLMKGTNTHDELQRVMLKEIDFYKKASKLDKFMEINALT
ncbi:Phosphoribosylaminoimidazole-succinocarboxamide synthase [Candidatus Magnetoovum chiemensis]|nr:Phosphoribosylaminoimidazole-succinocarboxamide synthase [Candidatus Magnetoovum chiemensis]